MTEWPSCCGLVTGRGAAGCLGTASAETCPNAISSGWSDILTSQTIAMTAIQKTIVVVIILGALAVGVHQAFQASKLRKEVQSVRARQEQAHSALVEQVQSLERERDRASNQLAAASAQLDAIRKNPAEVHKLRGEVGRLRRENAEITESSPLSRVTANPDAVKLMRQQQKAGMGMIYRGFSSKAKLTPEQTEQLNNLLADHIMDNVNQVTALLKDKPGVDKINEVFSAQDAVLEEEVRTLLGEDSFAQYKDYTRQLLSTLSADQFKRELTGTDEIKADKAKQLSQALDESLREALANAGLPEDYQALPILNFRNIASEQQGDLALKVLDDIYQRTARRGTAFLSPEELAKLEEFRGKAIENSRGALTLNRTMMAPLSD